MSRNSSALCDDLHDAVERVAARAVEQELLLVVGAGHARQPFRIGERIGEVFHLGHLQLGLGLLAGRHFGIVGAGEFIASRARLDRILAGVEPVGRERKAPLRVGHDADRDGRAVLLGGDHNAFHVAFLGGRDLAGQGRLRIRDCGAADNRCQSCCRGKQGASHIHGSFLSGVEPNAFTGRTNF